ncbi:MAG: DUF2797 domain-containing protein [Nitrospinota bacterium]|nr:DUF2797 domain-containing protein [Nitrospinota bacterium]
MKVAGQLRKMTHEEADPIQYFLSLDEKLTAINPEIGRDMSLKFLNKITCIECGRSIKKTYDQGYCFPCARDLPENAMCAVRPEKCEHEFGNEQDREFFEKYCKVDHLVYLSLTSGVKVGVTRHWNIPSRWIDQGAVQGLVIARTPERKLSGLIEVALAEHMADKTNWRKMLKGELDPVDLKEIRSKVSKWFPDDLKQYFLNDQDVCELHYPVVEVPPKIVSHNLDKEPHFRDRLTGIKGQYLIFDNRVINLRKYGGYHVEFESFN